LKKRKPLNTKKMSTPMWPLCSVMKIDFAHETSGTW